MAKSLALCDIKDIQQQLLWLTSGYLTQLGIWLCFSNPKAALFLVRIYWTIHFLLLGSGRQSLGIHSTKKL